MIPLNRAALFEMFKHSLHTVAVRTSSLDIHPTDNLLFDLELDSLEAIEVVTRMIKQAGLELSPTIVAQVTTIDSLLDLFEEAAKLTQTETTSKEKEQ